MKVLFLFILISTGCSGCWVERRVDFDETRISELERRMEMNEELDRLQDAIIEKHSQKLNSLESFFEEEVPLLQELILTLRKDLTSVSSLTEELKNSISTLVQKVEVLGFTSETESLKKEIEGLKLAVETLQEEKPIEYFSYTVGYKECSDLADFPFRVTKNKAYGGYVEFYKGDILDPSTLCSNLENNLDYQFYLSDGQTIWVKEGPHIYGIAFDTSLSEEIQVVKLTP